MTAPSPCPNRSCYRTPSHPGFTLAELLVSVVSMAVLMAGIASTIVLTTRAVDDGTNPAARIRAATSALDLFIQDAGCALTISENTITALVFTVPDRDADGQDESIRYEWLGAPGDPLTRQYNGGPVVNILEDVQQLFVSYQFNTEDVEEPGADVEGAETLLVSYNSTSDLSDFVVDSGHWIGQYFLPSLPADAVSWSVTRVQFPAMSNGATNGQVNVQLRQATISGLPTRMVLEGILVDESSLGDSYTPWQEVAFSSVSGLFPGQRLCLVLEHVSDAHSCRAQYQDRNASPPNTHLVETSNGGSSWTAPSGGSMLFKVYGTITTAGQPTSRTLSRMTCVNVTLHPALDSSSRIDTSVQMLNAPEVVN